MPIKFTFASRDRKHASSDGSRPLSENDIKEIVNREVHNADTKNKIMACFDEMTANNIKTEALLTELKDTVDASIEKLDIIAKCEDKSDDFARLDASIKKVAVLSENIEYTIHKDNLASYKNLKEILENIDEDSKRRDKKLSGGIAAAIVLGAISLIGILYLVYITFPQLPQLPF